MPRTPLFGSLCCLLVVVGCSSDNAAPADLGPGSVAGNAGAASGMAGAGGSGASAGSASAAGGNAGSAGSAPATGGQAGTAGTAGSAGAGGSDAPPPMIQIDPARTGREDISFSPADADETANVWHGNQLGSFDASKPVQAKLVVTMGGIGAGPHSGGAYQYAVGRGFHCLAVDMFNDEGGESNEGKVYLETWSGQDLTPVADVSPVNSVQGRIKAALGYLNAQDPGADWDFYLDAQGEVRWQDVILFGYSYGGQTAVAATKYVAPHRVVVTAAPNIPDEATWITTMPNVADVNKCYAINSESEADKFDTLSLMGWPGEPEVVMDAEFNMIMDPPFNGTSKIQAPGGHTEFCSVAGDRYDVICDFAFDVKP